MTGFPFTLPIEPQRLLPVAHCPPKSHAQRLAEDIMGAAKAADCFDKMTDRHASRGYVYFIHGRAGWEWVNKALSVIGGDEALPWPMPDEGVERNGITYYMIGHLTPT